MTSKPLTPWTGGVPLPFRPPSKAQDCFKPPSSLNSEVLFVESAHLTANWGGLSLGLLQNPSLAIVWIRRKGEFALGLVWTTTTALFWPEQETGSLSSLATSTFAYLLAGKSLLLSQQPKSYNFASSEVFILMGHFPSKRFQYNYLGENLGKAREKKGNLFGVLGHKLFLLQTT